MERNKTKKNKTRKPPPKTKCELTAHSCLSHSWLQVVFRSKAGPGSIRMICLGKKQAACIDTTKSASVCFGHEVWLAQITLRESALLWLRSWEPLPDSALIQVMQPGVTALSYKSHMQWIRTRNKWHTTSYALCNRRMIKNQQQSRVQLICPHSLLPCKIHSLESKCLAYFSFHSRGWFMPENTETPPHSLEK